MDGPAGRIARRVRGHHALCPENCGSKLRAVNLPRGKSVRRPIRNLRGTAHESRSGGRARTWGCRTGAGLPPRAFHSGTRHSNSTGTPRRPPPPPARMRKISQAQTSGIRHLSGVTQRRSRVWHSRRRTATTLGKQVSCGASSRSDSPRAAGSTSPRQDDFRRSRSATPLAARKGMTQGGEAP